MKRIRNLRRSPHDPRDKKYAAIAHSHLYQPKVVNLATNAKLYSLAYDQLEFGCCTGNSWTFLAHYILKKDAPHLLTDDELARMFVYTCERIGEGTLLEDAGSDMRTGGDVLHDIGICFEKEFPYTEKNLTTNPSAEAYASAAHRRKFTYYAVDGINEIRSCLIQGYPVVFGFEVPEAFMNSEMENTGEMSLADWRTPTDGGHAVTIVGYNDYRQAFLVRNSWGTDWGFAGGHFWMPYSMMPKDTFDHFTARIQAA